MLKASVKEARQNFSTLLDQVENGEEVLILRRGRVIAHIVPHVLAQKKQLPSLKKFRDEIDVDGIAVSEMIRQERKKR